MKMRTCAYVLAGVLALLTCGSSAVAEEIRDYYSEPGINPFKETLNQSANEHIDPFSGILQLKYTDIHVPGNGGMDIDITRTYTSLPTSQYPAMNINGLGWTMHMGRIVVPSNQLAKRCNQTVYNANTSDNPSLELPDGGRELLVLSSYHNDGTLITRSNWIARCTVNGDFIVTAPDGTRYTMDKFENFQQEPAFLTTRIEDVHGNWIAIDYTVNAVGINYMTQIRRSDGGTVVTFEYEDINTQGIAMTAVVAGAQRWTYGYEVIADFAFPNYKQLVRATPPDGRSWHYRYNPKMPDPDPNDGVLEEGIASYSLNRLTYPYGAAIDYTYQYVLFDPGSPEKTTSIHTKTSTGSQVTAGTWTYEFAPHSEPYPDGVGGTLRYDVTTITTPDAKYRYAHMGKDYRAGSAPGETIFVRPSFVGLLMYQETWSKGVGASLLERRANSWGQRKISEEDFWHGGNRGWWRDDGTYTPVLTGEYVSRDSHISGNSYAHARVFENFDVFGNPGKRTEYSNVQGGPSHLIEITYRNITDKWIIGLPEDETHEKVVSGVESPAGTVEREYNSSGLLMNIREFGEETIYTYNADGDIATRRDARGKITSYSDYKRGIARYEEQPESIIMHRVVNDSGTLRSETSGRGHLTSYTYDDLNRLTSIDYPIKADVSIAYDDGNGVFTRSLTRGTYLQKETINDFGDILRTERRDQATGQTVYRTSSFDALGRVTFTSYPNQSMGNTTAYDALGRTLRITHPDGSFVRYVHDDATTSVINERNFESKYAYQVMGTAYNQDDPVSIYEPESVGTSMMRDMWGNITRLFQGERLPDNSLRGYAKTYRYDDSQQLVESFEPEVGTTVFEHDAVGNIISESVNDLPAVTFAYDGQNRRTRVDFPDSTPDIVTEFDESANIKRVTKGTTEWFYVYDENENLQSERLTINHPLFAPRVYTIARTYSELDVLASITYPSGLMVDYAPDAMGRATKVGTFASNLAYHPSGAIASYELANGVTTSVTLNQRLMTQNISAGGIVNLSYGYDAGGNVMQIADAIDASRNVSMDSGSYDGLDRLRRTTGSWGTAMFSYDFHGNFVNKDIGQRGMRYWLDSRYRVRAIDRYNPANGSSLNALMSMDYDARGNTVLRRQVAASSGFDSIEERLFDYDSASLLVRARVNSVGASGITSVAYKDYLYDGNGQRVLEQKHGSYDLRFSVYAKDGSLLFEDSVAECMRSDHIRLGSLGIARSDDRSAAPTLDTDGDQIPDCLETQLGLNLASAMDAAADSDGDGLTNLQEYRAGTSLTRVDTDGDGISDRDELQRDLTDPTDADTDGDGLADGVEVANPALDPRSRDKDHDGVSDYWETRLSTDPANGADGLLDSDGDGFSNRQESGARSNPQVAGAKPARGTALWSANTLGSIWGAAAIGRDRAIHVAARDGRVYAFNPDGTRRWVFGMASSNASDPTVGPDGTVYMVSTLLGGVNEGAPRSFVRALNPDGTERWSYGTTDFLNTAVAIGEEGKLYVGGLRYNGASVQGLVMSLSANGTDVLAKPWASGTLAAPVVAPNGDIYFSDSNKRIYSFTKTLDVRWNRSTRGTVDVPLAIAKDGNVYAADSSGYVYAMTAAGSLRWEKFISNGPQLSSLAIGADGRIYVGGYQSLLVALQPQDGATVWSASTSGTTYTPAIAANGNVYATTHNGDLIAFDSAGAKLWTYETRTMVSAPPIIDRDGTIYFGSEAGQLFAVADNGGGAAVAPWPMHRHDSAASNYVCFNEPAFSIVADGDGDHIDDCAELRYGLDPANPADGSADNDGDGLRNFEEHQAGTRLDLADTDGDGLSDGLEVLTYHTNPLDRDSDHDAINDDREIALSTNPLDSVDGLADSDNDGFSNRQEVWANTDPMSISSHPLEGQVLRTDSGTTYNMFTTLGRDGIIYQSSGNNSPILALYPGFAQRWSLAMNVIDSPAILPDGSIFFVRLKSSSKVRMTALWPNGLTRWVYTLTGESSSEGIFEQPAIGADGTIYFVWGSSSLRALDINGQPKAGWPPGGVSVFASRPKIAIGPSGNVVVYDSLNSVSSYSPAGVKQWESRASAILGGGNYETPVVAPDGRIYLRNNNGLHAIDPTNGSRLWVRAGANGVPLIAANGNIVVYCGQSPSSLCSLAPDGTTVWQETTGLTFAGVPAIDIDGHIFALTNNNRFVAFNADGTLRWNTSLGAATQTSGTMSPMLLPDGTIYIQVGNSRVLLAGAGRGLATTGWPSADRDYRASRNSLGYADIAPNPAPSVFITAPATSTIDVEVGENYSVSAQATDGVEGDISSRIRWTSSLDGEFAIGASASLSSLRIGVHTISATVTDSENLASSATLTVNKAVIPPVLNLTSPVEGRIFDVGEQVSYQASATDHTDGTLSSRIGWNSSLDGQLAVGANGKFSNLSAGSHVITASVTDNNGATDSKSVNISVQFIGPNVNVSSPAEGKVVEPGMPLTLSATAVDGVDGDVSSTLTWSSDRDGLLGSGSNLAISTLSAGSHLITASAVDHAGAPGFTQRHITVGYQPPRLTLYNPTEGYTVQVGTSVYLYAVADDIRDGDLSASIQWASTLDGPLGSGSELFRSNLSVGTHYVSATVTDSDNLSQSLQRRVRVQSSTNSAPGVSSLQPGSGAQFYSGEPVALSCSPYDADGPTPTVQWSSNINGVLGTGSFLTLSNLSVGTHTIKALVTDGLGAKGAEFMTLIIVPAPADYPPELTFAPFAAGAVFTPNDAFPLTATATDREDGNISSRIHWSSDISGPLGTGSTITVAGLAEGAHQITASVTDNYGNTFSDYFSLDVVSGATPAFLNEDFAAADLSEWEFVDDGPEVSSSWGTATGRVVETSDTQSGSSVGTVIDKPGTYLRHKLGAYWLDYRLEATLRSTDDDALGVMFRYVDNDNYYRFSMDRERSYRRLVKKVNGVYTTLWQDAVRYSLSTSVNVVVTAIGSSLKLSINGTQVYSGTDPDLRRGTIALYSWGENQAQFDNVRVYNLRTATSNDPPQVTISNPAAASNFVVGTPVTFSGTAVDFEDGVLSAGLAWTSSRDGALGTGASVTANALTQGTHIFTASATDSDNVTGTATVTVNVNAPFNDPPALSVTAPTQGATFNLGTAVSFAGTATDVEDGTISNGITWTSSRDGLIGTGASLNVSTLSAGAHVITTNITDAGGKSATVTRNIAVVVAGNNDPTLILSSPLNGAAYGVGQSVAFSATASDTEDGNLTNQIAWASSRDGALGTGGALNVSTLTGGLHTITATVEDSMGGTRSVSVSLSIVPTAATLLRDDFNDNNYTGWSVTNQGTVSAPSVWSAATGALRQTSDISSTPTTVATVPKPGTFNRWTAGSAWTNYSVTTELRSSDNDTLGVMFRYTSTSNYYRFSMDSERANRRLTKVRNGTWTVLWEDSTAYTLNRTYVLEVIASGATITVKLDGVQLWSGTDTNALTSGTIALYSWMNTGAQFDNVLVRDLSVPFSGLNEPKRGLDRLRQNATLLAQTGRKPAPRPPRKPPDRVALLFAASTERNISAGVAR